MLKQNTDGNSSWLKTDNVLVAFISITAYFLSYVFELGYASTFGIPEDLISIELQNVFLFFVVAGVLFVYYYLSAEGLYSLVPKELGPFTVLPFFILTAVLYTDGWSYHYSGLIVVLCITLLVCAGYIGVWIEGKREAKRKKNDAETEDKDVDKKSKKTDKTSLREAILPKWISDKFLVFVVVIAELFYLIYVVGAGIARKRGVFWVTDTDPQMAVLRIYNDKMVCAAFDREQKTYKNRYAILKVGEDSGLSLRYERIGPLEWAGRKSGEESRTQQETQETDESSKEGSANETGVVDAGEKDTENGEEEPQASEESSYKEWGGNGGRCLQNK